MRSGPVGYHNKMRQLESTCNRKVMAIAEKHLICFCYVSVEPQTLYMVYIFGGGGYIRDIPVFTINFILQKKMKV